ncbi:MAG: hypothetical protein ACRENV_05955, partial [Candidatus Dormibacteria bacterium]
FPACLGASVSGDWWAGVGPAEAELACGDGTHRLRWEAGHLVALDHPDPEGELVLTALGGAKVACVELVEAWRRHDDDLGALVLGPRGPHDGLTLSGQDVEVARASATSVGRTVATSAIHQAPASPLAKTVTRQLELLSLLALGGRFQERLMGAVATTWAARLAEPCADPAAASVEATLEAALAGRAAPVVGAWLGIDPDEVIVDLYEGSGWGHLRWSNPGAAQRVSVELCLDWLSRVWAPGMAVVDGYLVVAVEHAAWPEATVLALPDPDRSSEHGEPGQLGEPGEPGQATERIALRFEGQAWRLCEDGNVSEQDR